MSELDDLPQGDEPTVDEASDGEGTRRFRSAWRTLGLDERAARRRLSVEDRFSSVRPRAAPSMPPPAAELPLITVGSSASDAELVLKTEIGDGGMGVIFAAKQRSLGREVAVKRLVPEAQGDEARAALVREARVTGSLEHPNVTPVHALGSDAHGRPVMVMRRVHGTPWGTLLRSRRASIAPTDDALTAHLEILLQVCNVVRFAHSRDVIHGDLKPDNVMVGAYGEIYVLDWGAAMSTKPDDPRGLPFSGDVRTVNGTPAYMAPEMVGLGSTISERTDVYLLGAVLHEILTGAAPHAGESLYDTMKSAFLSRAFKYPRHVPRELAAICKRAMAANPEDRFADVDEMRRAIAEHIDHRASIALGVEAAARREQLEATLAAGHREGAERREGAGQRKGADRREGDERRKGAGPREGAERRAGAERREGERREMAHQLYAECRFGFQQARRAWPGNEEARVGLERAVVAMVGFEIAAGDARAATLLASELEGPHPELRERLAALVERVEDEGAELSRLRTLERDLDADAQSRPRSIFVAILVTLGAAMLVFALLFDGTGATRAGRVAFAVVLPLAWVVLGAGGAWAGGYTMGALPRWGLRRRSPNPPDSQRRVLPTRASRIVVGGVLTAGVAIFVNRSLTVLLRGGSIAEAIVGDLVICGVVAAMIALSADRRFAAASACFLLAAVPALLFPAHALLVLVLALLCFALGMAASSRGEQRGGRPLLP